MFDEFGGTRQLLGNEAENHTRTQEANQVEKLA
jgi:hypothetical protein